MSNFFVTIQGIASVASQQKILAVIKMANMEENCRLLFFDYSEFDIPTGEHFLYLINRKSGESFEIKGELKLVTQNQGLAFDSIPKGHKTICKVCFDEKSLSIITSKIPTVDSWEILSERYILSNALQPT